MDSEILNFAFGLTKKSFVVHQTKTFVILTWESFCFLTFTFSQSQRKERTWSWSWKISENIFFTATSINIAGISCRSFFFSLIPLHQRPSVNDLMFHFFGVENDSMRVREAINKMVEKGRIGNFSLLSTHYALHQEPGLILQVSERSITRHIHFISAFNRAHNINNDVMQTQSLY